MTLAVRKLEVADVETLHTLVIENIDAIEAGLTVLDSRLLLGQAGVDIVALDRTGALALVTLGFMADEEMLLRAVEAYSWCLEYPDAIRRLYPSAEMSSARPPRLVFVIGRMPDAFHRKIKQLGFPDVDCVEFRYLDVNGTAAVYFETRAQIRRSVAVSSVPPPVKETPKPSSERVVPLSTAITARATGVKLERLLHQAIAEVSTREPTVVSIHRNGNGSANGHGHPNGNGANGHAPVLGQPAMIVKPRAPRPEPAPPAPAVAPVADPVELVAEPAVIPTAEPALAPAVELRVVQPAAAKTETLESALEALAQSLAPAEITPAAMDAAPVVVDTPAPIAAPAPVIIPTVEPIVTPAPVILPVPGIAPVPTIAPAPLIAPVAAAPVAQPLMPMLEPVAIVTPVVAPSPAVAPLPLIAPIEPIVVTAVEPVMAVEPAAVEPASEPAAPIAPIVPSAQPSASGPVVAAAGTERVSLRGIAALLDGPRPVDVAPIAPVAPRAAAVAPAPVPAAPQAEPKGELRVSFADVAKELLGGAGIATPITTPVVAPVAVAAVDAPQMSAVESAGAGVVESAGSGVEEIIAEMESAVAETPAAQPLVVDPTPVVAPAAPVAATRMVAPSPAPAEVRTPVIAPAPVVAPAKAAAPMPATAPTSQPQAAKVPELPQAFEGLKFPNDGVLTRQWMEFLNQMAATK
jgi:hypothetical protein